MNISRRNFFKVASATAFSFSILPSRLNATSTLANTKLNIAIVGAGGRGNIACQELKTAKNANVVAICDVDTNMARGAYAKFQKAARYTDYRKMFDKEANIDAVVISSPDHSHYPIASWAMVIGKHVYVERPLTRTILESRYLKKLADAKPNTITQFGNQAHLYDGWRKLKEWIDADIFGDILEIHHWTDRPTWNQNILNKPSFSENIPSNLDFAAWLNVAPKTNFYSRHITPTNWKAIQDYGTGAIGDIGCHFLDWSYSALGLDMPNRISSNTSDTNDYTWHKESTCVFEFDAKENKSPLKIFWYEGKRKPQNINKIPQEEIDKLNNASIIVGSKGSAICSDYYGSNIMIYPKERALELSKERAFPNATLARVRENIYHNWVNSCIKGEKAQSDIANYGADFNEFVLLANVASFFKGQCLEYSKEKGVITNIKEANARFQSSYNYNEEFIIDPTLLPIA